MAHEILSVKLYQLDEQLGRLHSRIHISETATHDRLRREIDALEQERIQADAVLRERLHRSKAPLVSVLSRNYGQIEGIIQEMCHQLAEMESGCADGETMAEDKILLAEYALDFAQQAAERALLLSLEAIDAQLLLQNEEGR